MSERITPEDRKAIKEFYGIEIEALELATFEKLHKELRKKYHPDKFERYDDAIVREMAHEKFQKLETLGEKIRKSLATGGNQKTDTGEDILNKNAVFAFDNMKIEILTRDKDLKYRLFGSYLRWLEWGDRYTIPDTKASIIMDENHRGVSIGFTESVKMYLTFNQDDNLEEIIRWLFQRIEGNAHAVIIEGQRIPVDLNQMLSLMRRKSFLRIEAPK